MKWEKIFYYFRRRRKLFIIILSIITVVLAYFAFQTRIDMGTYTLLPEEDKTVKNFNTISKEFGGFDNLILLISSDNERNSKKTVQLLAPKMNKLSNVIKSVEYKIPTEFIRNHWLFYLKEDQFNELIALISDPNSIEILKMKNTLSVLDYLSVVDQEVLDSVLDQNVDEFLQKEMLLDNNLVIDEGYYKIRNTAEYMIILRPTNPNHDMIFFKEMVTKDLYQYHLFIRLNFISR